jgi:opacity protein-like surface antigen
MRSKNVPAALFPVLTALLAMAAPASAVDLEFKRTAGIAWSRFSTPPSPIAIPEVGYFLENRVTLVFGAGIVYRITSHLSLDVTGEYIRKGTCVERRYWDTPLSTFTYDLRMLSVPFCLRYGLLRGSTPYVLGGFEVSYVIGHDLKYFPVGSDSGTVQKLGSSTRRIDFATVLGGGVEFVFKQWALFAELRYSAGLVNLSKSIADYPVVKTRTFSLQVGFRTGRRPFPF